MISSEDVTRFKTSVCDENLIIAGIIRDVFVGEMPEIIMDVGAGLGDIAGLAFPDKRAIILDPLEYEVPLVSEHHERTVGDFFDSTAAGVGTLLFSHSLQFLDSNPQRLHDKIHLLNPNTIVTVTNTNRDLMGILIGELRRIGHIFNAEETVPLFPPSNYFQKKEYSFTATINAHSFLALAEAVAYLVDATTDSTLIQSCQQLLIKHLPRPSMTIDQNIRLFKNEE